MFIPSYMSARSATLCVWYWVPVLWAPLPREVKAHWYLGCWTSYKSYPNHILCIHLAAEEDSLVFEGTSFSLLCLIVFYIIYFC